MVAFSEIHLGYIITHAVWVCCIIPLWLLSIFQWISDRNVSHSFEVRRQTIGYTKLIFHRLQLFASTLCIIRCVDPQGAYRLLTTGEMERFLSVNTTACIVAAGAVAVVTMIDSLYALMSRSVPTWSPRLCLSMIIGNFLIANGCIIYALIINREWPTGIFLLSSCFCFFVEFLLMNISLLFLRRHLSRQHHTIETYINPLGYIPAIRNIPPRNSSSIPHSQRSSTFHSRNGSNDSDPDMIYHPPTLPEYPTPHTRQLSTDSLDTTPSNMYRTFPSSYNMFGGPTQTYIDPTTLTQSQSSLILQSQAISTALKKMTMTQFIASLFLIAAIAVEIYIAKDRIISHKSLSQAYVNYKTYEFEPFQWMQVLALILIIWYAWIPLKLRATPSFPLLEEDLLASTRPTGNLNPDLQIPVPEPTHDEDSDHDGYDSDQERIGRTTRQPHGPIEEGGGASTYNPTPSP